MRSVTLARSWYQGSKLCRPGDVVEVEDDVAAWLERTGALAPSRPAEPQAESEKEESDPPAAESQPKPEEPEAPKQERPLKTASIEQWRTYAESLGIVTKGLSKQDLIAATQ